MAELPSFSAFFLHFAYKKAENGGSSTFLHLVPIGAGFGFRGVVAGMVELRVKKFVRHVLLFREMVGIVVRIEIAVVIAQFFHQFSGRIAQV